MNDPVVQATSYNQQVYQRLKMALSLNLRRQLFIVVCDDLNLRNNLAVQLYRELSSEDEGTDFGQAGNLGNYGNLVNLKLDLADPNPIAQVSQWLRQNTTPEMRAQQMPAFQVLGVEMLTRQPAAVQRLFLSYLRTLERHLPALNSCLVLWVTKPWYYHIRQSAPECWQWCTGIFEFVSEPLPAREEATQASPSTPDSASSRTAAPGRGTGFGPQGVGSPAGVASGFPSGLSSGVASGVASGNGLGTKGVGQNGMGQNGMGQNGMGQNGAGTGAGTYGDRANPANPASQPIAQPMAYEQGGAEARISEPSLPHVPANPAEGFLLNRPATPAATPATATATTAPTSAPTPPGAPPPPPPLATVVTNPGAALPVIKVPGERLANERLVDERLVDESLAGEVVSLDAGVTEVPAVDLDLLLTPDAVPTQPPGESFVLEDEARSDRPLSALIDLRSTPAGTAHSTKSLTVDPVTDALTETAALATTVVADDDEDIAIGVTEVYVEDEPLSEADQLEAILLAKIEHLRSQDPSSEALAVSYLDLGRFYRGRLEQGDPSEFLRYAIVAYEQVLEWLCFRETPPEPDATISWADTLNDLGTLYWMSSRQPDSPELCLSYLKLAIQTYRLGLKNTPEELFPRPYSMLQNNLGTVHSDLAHHQDPIENLTEAIAAYQEALRFRRADTEPMKFASTQNNLGTAYWHLAQHERPADNLQSAINAYNQASQFYQQDQQPQSYAMIQNNLGTAYWNLAQYAAAGPSRATADTSPSQFSAQDWLQMAIMSYTNALRYRTLQDSPANYAATQNNLGTAYWQLANQCRDNAVAACECLQHSIEAYHETLQASQILVDQGLLPQLTFDLSATYSNLGLVHFQLASDFGRTAAAETRQAHLYMALQHQVQAINSWSARPELQQAAVDVLVQTVQKYFEIWGIQGQNRALGQIPGSLLPQLLTRL